MAKFNSTRKTRSDKFPLTLHKTGQFCKKIRGKMYYFGSNKQQALERYLEMAGDLHSGRSMTSRVADNKVTLKDLCNLYLEHQESRVQAGDITERYFADQVKCLRGFATHIGPGCLISHIKTIDLQDYRNRLIGKYESAAGTNIHLAIMKAMFPWAKKNDILHSIPNIDAVSKAKIVHKERPIFTSEQIQRLLDATDTQLKAIILLGLNCGFGCTDCAKLRWKDLDLENRR